ncbi:hypothetical protein J6590_007272 [Homalodisca vitripennis]|nr:hypothetical protein J6590_007272 [Homalodisca vitripennis]
MRQHRPVQSGGLRDQMSRLNSENYRREIWSRYKHYKKIIVHGRGTPATPQSGMVMTPPMPPTVAQPGIFFGGLCLEHRWSWFRIPLPLLMVPIQPQRKQQMSHVTYFYLAIRHLASGLLGDPHTAALPFPVPIMVVATTALHFGCLLKSTKWFPKGAICTSLEGMTLPELTMLCDEYITTSPPTQCHPITTPCSPDLDWGGYVHWVVNTCGCVCGYNTIHKQSESVHAECT